MDFLSNLFNSAKSTVGSAINNVGSFLGNVGNTIGSAVGSVSANSLKASVGEGLSPRQAAAAQAVVTPNRTVQASFNPNISTPSGQAYADHTGKLFYNTPTGASPVPSGYQAPATNQSSVYPNVNNPLPASPFGTYRPSTPAPTQNFQQNTQASGLPRMDAYNRPVNEAGIALPTANVSGASGFSSGTNFSTTTPATSPSGIGGSSSFTGLLGGASGLGTPSTGSYGEDQNKDKAILTIGNAKVPVDPKMFSGFSIGPNGQLVQGAKQYKQPIGPSLPTPQIGSTIDVNALNNTRNETAGFNSIPEAGSANDYGESKQQMITYAQDARQKIDAANPTPPTPIQDTKEYMNMLQQVPQGQQGAFTQTNDQLNKQNGVPELLSQRIDGMKNIQAAMDGYNKIIKDIKENPNLPKGLAQRRIEAFTKENKVAVDALIGSVNILNQQITDAQNIVHEQLGVMKDDQAAKERVIDNNRQVVNLLISSGAISVLDDNQLSQMANSSGLTIDSLKAIKTKVTENSLGKEIITNEDAKGNLVGIDKSTGKVLWKQAGFGTPASSGGLTPTQQISMTGVSFADSAAQKTFLAYSAGFQDWIRSTMQGVKLTAPQILQKYVEYENKKGYGGFGLYPQTGGGSDINSTASSLGLSPQK